MRETWWGKSPSSSPPCRERRVALACFGRMTALPLQQRVGEWWADDRPCPRISACGFTLGLWSCRWQRHGMCHIGTWHTWPSLGNQKDKWRIMGLLHSRNSHNTVKQPCMHVFACQVKSNFVACQAPPLDHGFQARILEGIAISFSRGSNWGINPHLLHCQEFFTTEPILQYKAKGEILRGRERLLSLAGWGNSLGDLWEKAETGVKLQPADKVGSSCWDQWLLLNRNFCLKVLNLFSIIECSVEFTSNATQRYLQIW